MLGKAHRPPALCRRAARRGRRERERRGTSPLPAFLAVPIALLALAAPASAAGSLTGVLDTVATATAPTVDEAVSATAPLAPSPAAAGEPAGELAPAPADRAVEQTIGSSATSSTGAVGSELPAASTHHDQTTTVAPADRPQSAPRSGADANASGSTLSRTIGAGDGAGTAITARQRRSDPIGRVVHGVALAASRTAQGASRPSDPLPADGALAPSKLAGAARRLVETVPAAIAALPARPVGALGLPSLSEVAVPGELPSLSTLPLLAILPSLPDLPALMAPQESVQSPVAVFTAVPPPSQPAPPQPIARSSPAAAAGGDRATPSTVTAPQGAGHASTVAQGYGATSNGIRSAIAATDQRRGSTRATAGGLRGAPSPAAGTTACACDETARAATGTGTASSGGVYRQPSPAPAPGGASPATGAVAGTSIPIFLTLAGLLLLAAPRVRRVLRLQGESWRLSPLALILERPG
jgi:hypothetical protein